MSRWDHAKGDFDLERYEESLEVYEAIEKKYRGQKKLFSILAMDEAIYYLEKSKKEAGNKETRGALVSRAISFYIRNHEAENRHSEIAYLRDRVQLLETSINRLQEMLAKMHRELEEAYRLTMAKEESL